MCVKSLTHIQYDFGYGKQTYRNFVLSEIQKYAGEILLSLKKTISKTVHLIYVV